MLTCHHSIDDFATVVAQISDRDFSHGWMVSRVRHDEKTSKMPIAQTVVLRAAWWPG
jgi:hypothetical protein